MTPRKCLVQGCTREAMPDAAVCRDDMALLYRNELTREADGTYSRRVVFLPEWRRRALAGKGLAKDMTGRIAA